MSTHKSTRARNWISILLLLHIVAMLLPASAGPVQAQADACGGAGVQSAHLAAGAVVSADQEVEIPKELVDASIFQANWRSSFKDVDLVKALIDMEITSRVLYKLDDATWRRVTNEFSSKYEEVLRYENYANGQTI